MHFTGKAYQRGVSKLVVILLVLLIVILLAVGTAAALYLTGVISAPDGDDQEVAQQDEAEEEPSEPTGPAQYMRLGDAITVNIDREGGRRAILQARLELMARDEEVLEGVERHMPVIRNNLIILFGDQSYENVSTSEGKNALRERAREEINEILREEGEPPHIEAVYFTQLVTQ